MKKFLFVSWVGALLFISSCELFETISPNKPVAGDYLPATKKISYFLREQFTDPDLSYQFYADTIKIMFARDTLIGNKMYQVVEYYNQPKPGDVGIHDVFKIFRRDGSRYLQTPLYPDGVEYVFLDTDKPEGSTWFYYSGVDKETKTIFTVKAVTASREINGNLYNNVIEMQTETLGRYLSGGYYRVNLTTRYFVKDVGEIYSLSAWFTYTGALRLTLL